MQTSKIYVITFGFLFLMTGCFKPQGKSTSEIDRLGEHNLGNATWIAGEISGKSEVSKVDETFKIPTARLYNFTVCVKDRRTQENLLTQKFKVETATGEKSIRPDARGCLNWSDEIAFNFLADAKILKLERKITAESGGHAGARTFGFAINPWSDDDEVLDLTKLDVPADQTVSGEDVRTLLSSLAVSKPLWVAGVKLLTTRVTGGATMLHMEIAPKVWLKNVKSERFTYQLKEGRYKLKYSLHAVGSQGVDRAQLTDEVVHANVSMSQNLLVINDELKLKSQPSTGRIEMQLSLEPLSGPKGLEVFSGTFLLGNADSLRGSHEFTLDPVASNGAPISPPALSIAPSTSAQTTAGRAASTRVSDLRLQSASGFDVSPLSGVATRYENESASRRTFYYTIKACLTDTNDGNRKMREMPIQIFKGKQAMKCLDAPTSSTARNVCVSDQDGCVIWEEKLTHEYYGKERYLTTEYTFKAQSGEVKRTAVVNPWEPESVFFFLQDLKNVGEQTVKTVNERAAKSSQVLAFSYSYNRVRTRYSIDSYLSLTSKRAIQLTIDLRVVRDTIRRGRFVMEPLRPGFYLLKVALHRDYRENGRPYKFVSPVSQIVRVIDGKIVTPVEFSTRDMALFALRSQLIVEIAPLQPDKVEAANGKTKLTPAALDALIDTKSDLKPRSFLGPIILEEKAAASSLRPTDDLGEAHCKTMDCDAYKATEPDSVLETDAERAKFYGSTKNLANMSVTKLAPTYKQNEDEYNKRLGEQSNFGNFIALHNAEYIPVRNGDKLAKLAPRLLRLNKRYMVDKDPAGQFLKHLNMTTPKRWSFGFDRYPTQPMDVMSLGHLIHGHSLSGPTALRLCAYWLRTLKVIPQQLPYLTEKCYRGATGQRTGFYNITDAQIETPFLIEPKLRIQDMAEPIVELGQKTNLKVGAHFSLSTSEMMARTNSVSVSPTAVLELIPSKIFSALLGGFNWTLSRDHMWSKDQSQGRDVETGTSLYVERAVAKLTAKAYERCAVIRMHPAFIEQFKIAGQMLGSRADKAWSLTRGIILCKGFVERTPLSFDENYYFLSGAKGEERMLDLDEAQNQPWAMGLRGLPDYNRFLSWIQAKPEGGVDNADKSSGLADGGFERLRDAYRFATPTFPAVISIDATVSAQRH